MNVKIVQMRIFVHIKYDWMCRVRVLFICLFIFLLTVALIRLFCFLALHSKMKLLLNFVVKPYVTISIGHLFFQLHCTAVAHRSRNLSPHFWGGELLLIYFSHMLNCKCATVFVFDNCFVYSRECFSASGWHMRVTQLELVMCLIWNSQSVSALGFDL